MVDIRKVWEELNKQEQEEFIDESDFDVFKDYMNDPCGVLMEMANVVGNKVAVEKDLPFSFHFCDKDAIHQQHGARLKVIWNPAQTPSSADGYYELHGNYTYKQGAKKRKPSGKDIELGRTFCKKYKVLFAAVWEKVLDADPVQDYFKGIMSFRELTTKFKLKGRDYYNVNHCKTLPELEACVRKNKIFNMND